MAHINITVTGNEYTIEMDNHGWDYLTINGGQPMYVTGSTLKYKQASPFEFAAYASKSCDHDR